jgi:phosphonate degradation associated HDIG domain protein
MGFRMAALASCTLHFGLNFFTRNGINAARSSSQHFINPELIDNISMHPVIERIKETFTQRGKEQYGTESVTQVQHALQCGMLAEASGAVRTLVTAATLHDLGHIFHASPLPVTCGENLDDKHEWVAHDWLRKHFGPEVAEPIRLHVVAKRYLCTQNPGYEQALSPTSLKSYLDQGGPMSPEDLSAFEGESFHKEALALRVWDDLAKEQDKETPGFHHFMPTLEACLQ